MNLLVTKEAVDEVINYLATRPYVETYKIIPKLLNLQKGQPVPLVDPQLPAKEDTVEQAKKEN